MGTPKVAQLLASAALDTCLEVFSKSAVGGGANTSKSDSGDPNSDQQPKENPGSSDLSSEWYEKPKFAVNLLSGVRP